MAAFELTCAHVGIAGLALDVAGAIVLGWAFSAKQPEEIRAEIPEALNGPLFPGGVSVAFPQKLAESLIRQRAEARLGLFLLVTGFLLQGANAYLNLGSLTTGGQRLAAIPIILGAWAVAAIAWWRYVPWDERKTTARMEELTAQRRAERLGSQDPPK